MTPDDYLTSHGIDPQYVKDNFAWDWDEQSIKIPVYDEHGHLLFCRYRWLSPLSKAKFTSDDGAHATIYPLQKLKDQKDIVLCEGEPDCIKLWQEGIPAFTTTGGVAKFDEALASHFAGLTVHLCLDTDAAGVSALPKYIQKLEAAGATVKIMTLPTDVKDVCEFFAGRTPEAFHKLKSESKTPTQHMLASYSNPLITGTQMDTQEYPHKKWLVKGMIRGEGLQLITGPGGVGKSAFTHELARAVSTGNDLLGKFQVTKGRVLLLDKENDPIDVQTTLRAFGALNDDVIYHTAADTFSFLTIGEDGPVPTADAQYLTAYCAEHNINVVILDSLVDFFIGDENSSNDAALNINAWRAAFPNMAIIVIHHENKPPANVRRAASDRARGSTHIFNGAQGMLSLSTLDESTPDKIRVEHSKVRGARKMTPFEIDMLIKPDPRDPGETIIAGFVYQGELKEELLATEKAMRAVLDLLESNPTKEFDAKEIDTLLKDQINPRQLDTTLPEMRTKNLVISRTGERGKFYYRYKGVNEFVDDYVDNL